jgi:hypothetical protein
MHLGDILESVGHIEHFVNGMDFDAYRRDERTKSAVERKIQIGTRLLLGWGWRPRQHIPASTGYRRHRQLPVLRDIVENALRPPDLQRPDKELDLE